MRFLVLLLTVLLSISRLEGISGVEVRENEQRVNVYDERLFQDKLQVRFLGLHELGTKNNDATIITLPDGYRILIDTGNDAHWPKLKSMIDEMQIDTIDCIVLTHCHDDHVGALDELLAAYDVKRVVSVDFAESFHEVFSAINQGDTEFSTAKEGDAFQRSGVSLTVLSPEGPIHYPERMPTGREKTVYENNKSLVFKLEHEGISFLFTGDIYKDTEEALIDRWGKELQSTVLKVPHHGLLTSSSTLFLLEVEPEVSIIESGEPTMDTYENLAYRSDVYTTVAYGTILIVVDEGSYEVYTEFDDRTHGVYG